MAEKDFSWFLRRLRPVRSSSRMRSIGWIGIGDVCCRWIVFLEKVLRAISRGQVYTATNYKAWMLPSPWGRGSMWGISWIIRGLLEETRPWSRRTLAVNQRRRSLPPWWSCQESWKGSQVSPLVRQSRNLVEHKVKSIWCSVVCLVAGSTSLRRHWWLSW